MDIRDEAALDLCSRLDEVEAVCRPGGAVSKRSPKLADDVTRKTMALKGSLLKLKQVLREEGPPPAFMRDMPPLYLRATGNHNAACWVTDATETTVCVWR
jgi:hypothetical protein